MILHNLKKLEQFLKDNPPLAQDIIQKTHNFQSKNRAARKWISDPLCGSLRLQSLNSKETIKKEAPPQYNGFQTALY